VAEGGGKELRKVCLQKRSNDNAQSLSRTGDQWRESKAKAIPSSEHGWDTETKRLIGVGLKRGASLTASISKMKRERWTPDDFIRKGIFITGGENIGKSS